MLCQRAEEAVRIEDLACPNFLPLLGQKSIRVKRGLHGHLLKAKSGPAPEAGETEVEGTRLAGQTISWATQRQLGSSWAGENWGTGSREGGHDRHLIPTVGGLWPTLTASSSSLRRPLGRVPQCLCLGLSLASSPRALVNSYFPVTHGLSLLLWASYKSPVHLQCQHSFLCPGGT